MLKLLFHISLFFISVVLAAALVYWHLPSARFINDQFSHIEQAWNASHEAPAVAVDELDIKTILKDKVVQSDKDYTTSGYNAMVVRYQPGAQLLDMQGNVVHEWTMPYRKAFPMHPHIKNPVPDSNIYFEKVHVFPNGDLLGIYHATGTAPFGYGMVKLDKNSNILWTLAENTHHDFYIAPDNGHIFSLKQAFTSVPEAIRDKVPYDILADHIIEINNDGKLLSSFSIIDAFIGSPYKDLLYSTYNRGPVWDYLHTNSIERLEPVMANAFPQWPVGSFLISMRNINTVAVIDPQGEKVLWAYNGLWKNQHAAHFTKDGSIIVLDNRGLLVGDNEFSRIIAIDPKNLAVTFEYSDINTPFYTNAYGRLQRLTNGNSLITETLGRRIIEIDPMGEKIVWSLTLPSITAMRFPNIATPKKNQIHNRYQQDMVAALPNLATAIVYAERYSPEQLPFLQDEVK